MSDKADASAGVFVHELNIPIQITVRVGLPVAAGAAPTVATVQAEPAEEAARKDLFDPDYAGRGGYDPRFLGVDIPLPTLTRDAMELVSRDTTTRRRDAHVLDYHHYSLVMNRERRMAFFTACNTTRERRLMGSKSRKELSASEPWRLDPRIPKADQITTSEFYGPTPFDRGHLVRREDVYWGIDEQEQDWGNFDSFHYTNCSPQDPAYNRSNKDGIWGNLENQVGEQSASVGLRMSVFSGPVFRPRDPKFEGIRVPKAFFKVIATTDTETGELSAWGFLLSQAELVRAAAAEEATFDPGELAPYQVSLAKIQEVTDVRFPEILHDADVMRGGEESIRLSDGGRLEAPRAPRPRAERETFIVGPALLKQAEREIETGPALEVYDEEREAKKGERIAAVQRALAQITEEGAEEGVLTAPDDQATSILQSLLAERREEVAKLAEAKRTGLEVMFDTHDVAGWAFDHLPNRISGAFKKQDFIWPDDTVWTIPNDARIAILGDWGTGLYGAPVCARTIKGTQPRYDAIIHLGDVYYSGTEKEVRERFLAHWPDVPGASNWATNSNHEMYSGGTGYFRVTLKDPRFPQRSSCFAFQNDHFLFLGLDTAYVDHDLDPKQVAWIKRRIDHAGNRKVVLLSHHQPYSHFEGGGEELVKADALGPLLAAKKIFAWYWGHEHRCAFYERHAQWGLWGRTIGHSGYPAFRDKFDDATEGKTNIGGAPGDTGYWRWVKRKPNLPRALVLDGGNIYVKPGKPDGAKYSPNGFVSLALGPGTIREVARSAAGLAQLEQVIG